MDKINKLDVEEWHTTPAPEELVIPMLATLPAVRDVQFALHSPCEKTEFCIRQVENVFKAFVQLPQLQASAASHVVDSSSSQSKVESASPGSFNEREEINSKLFAAAVAPQASHSSTNTDGKPEAQARKTFSSRAHASIRANVSEGLGVGVLARIMAEQSIGQDFEDWNSQSKKSSMSSSHGSQLHWK